jgi:hypothetical protein
MSLGHSPKIVTDGLVFYYDMANTQKSWKGAPTFNASLQDGQNDVNPWSGDGTPTVLGIDPTVRFRGRKVAKFRTGTSGNCYINGATKLSTGTNSTSWTSTFFLKRVDGTALSSVGVYLYVTNNTNIVVGGISATLVEDGWYRVTYSGTGLVSGYPTLTGMYSLGSAVEYFFADWQCENLGISTPWVSGTRSNTQAVLDLVGGNTVTANSLTYNTNGTFSFDGNTSYLVPATPFNIWNTSFTISQWCFFLDDSRGILVGDFSTANAINTTFEKHTDRRLRLYWDANPDIYTGNNAIALNAWQHLTCIRNKTTSQVLFYVNGVLMFTHNGSLSDKIATVPHRIGADGRTGTTVTNGNIATTQIYNRALTADEVLQNFNATRSRYGV